MKYILPTLLIITLSCVFIACTQQYTLPPDTIETSSSKAEVKNVVPRQVGNRMVFEYDLIGEDREADVTVTITVDGKTYSSRDLHLEGDYGEVRTGRGRKIFWNVLQDFPRGYAGDIRWEIVAGGQGYTDPVTGMEFVYVKGGCFKMGDTFGDGSSDEKPVHEVCVDDFYIGKYEVTQEQWKAVMRNNPSYFKNCGDNCPVEQVSWNDLQEYIKKFNRKTGNAYRLPTEAEWEYACRSGGKKEKYAGGNSAGSVAWYDSNSGEKTHPAGQKRANGLGIYDMSGNVWEWVQDWYDRGYYKKSPKWNPEGPGGGSHRVNRGGGWNLGARSVRCAYRVGYTPSSRLGYMGFRVARTP